MHLSLSLYIYIHIYVYAYVCTKGGIVVVEVELTRASAAVDLGWLSQYPRLADVALLPNTYIELLNSTACVVTRTLDVRAAHLAPRVLAVDILKSLLAPHDTEKKD